MVKTNGALEDVVRSVAASTIGGSKGKITAARLTEKVSERRKLP
jgi:hypothetical protein